MAHLCAIKAVPAVARVSVQRRVTVVAAARPIRHEAAALGLAALLLTQPAMVAQADTGATYEQELLQIIENRTHKEQALPDLNQSPTLAAVEKAAETAAAVSAAAGVEQPLAALTPDERTQAIRAEAMRGSKDAQDTVVKQRRSGATASGETNATGLLAVLALAAVAGGAAYAQNAQQAGETATPAEPPRAATPPQEPPRESTPAPSA